MHEVIFPAITVAGARALYIAIYGFSGVPTDVGFK